MNVLRYEVLAHYTKLMFVVLVGILLVDLPKSPVQTASAHPIAIRDADVDVLYQEKFYISDTYINKTYTKQDIRNFIIDVRPSISTEDANKIVRAVVASSDYYKIPVSIIIGLMKVESHFQKDTVSNKHAVGLMQVYPKVWLNDKNQHNLKNAGIVNKKEDLFNIEKNILAGTYILSHYYYNALSEGLVKSKAVEYALTRYLGGTKNDHYKKTQVAINLFVEKTQRK